MKGIEMTQLTRARRQLYRNLYLYGLPALVILALLGAAYVLSPSGKESRQEEVAQRGTQVMPFDLERTTHTFTDLPTGGREVVVSDDGDAEQIALIRLHLEKEARRFASGDFSDPARITARTCRAWQRSREARAASSFVTRNYRMGLPSTTARPTRCLWQPSTSGSQPRGATMASTRNKWNNSRGSSPTAGGV